MKFKADHTGRFDQRPHFDIDEIERLCEDDIVSFLGSSLEIESFPISTNTFTKVIEQKTDELDLYADMTELNLDEKVEGFTAYITGSKPSVYINHRLSSRKYLETRLRSTLTHEYGHVLLHSPLFDEGSQCKLIRTPDEWSRPTPRTIAQRANSRDWMEWQANRAMSALLMPRKAVQALGTWYGQRWGFFPPFQLRSGHGVQFLKCCSTKFLVSDEVAEIRLKQMCYIIV